MTRRFAPMLILLALAAAVLFVPLPIPNSIGGRTIENAGHTPLFILITFGILMLLRREFSLAGARLYVLAGIIGVGVGFLTEVIQKPLRRDASWEDVLADALGVVLALALHALFARRGSVGRPARAVALVVALVAAAIYLAPVVRMTRAYVHRNGEFPVLADFRSPIELYWTVGYGVNREIANGALNVEFSADAFPGVAFHEPVPDWRAFRRLVIDVENPDDESLFLMVRVHDRRHSKMFADRFNRRFDLAAGERRTLAIELDDIRRGPRERPMDMSQISDITLFRGHPKGSRHLRIYSLRLE